MGGLEDLGIGKMRLLPLEAMRGKILGRLRIEKIIIWVVLRRKFYLFKVRMTPKLTLSGRRRWS